MELEIINNKEEKRFETYVEGLLAKVTYIETTNGLLAITGTHVPKELGGRGIAGELNKFALDYARENELKVNPICPYTKSYIEKHVDYQDLLFGKIDKE